MKVISILGTWIGESESSKFWLKVLNDLRNRGVEDTLIACKESLSSNWCKHSEYDH